MSDVSITIDVDAETIEALELLADLAGETLEQCAKRTLSNAARGATAQFDALIQEGEDAINRGEFLTHEEFKAWVANERAEVSLEIEQSKAA